MADPDIPIHDLPEIPDQPTPVESPPEGEPMPVDPPDPAGPSI